MPHTDALTTGLIVITCADGLVTILGGVLRKMAIAYVDRGAGYKEVMYTKLSLPQRQNSL